MAEIKWIKLNIDMFDNRKIRHLRKLPEGNSIVLIWVMLLTLAGKCNASGMIFLTENVPYTPKMLADELDFEEATIQLAINALERFGMISTGDGLLSISGWAEHQNLEGMEKIREQGRLRKARYDAKRRELLDSNATSNVTVTQGNATDKDKDIENKKKNKKELTDRFAAFWSAYPRKVAKANAEKAFDKVDVDIDVLLSALERQKHSSQWTRDNGQYIPHPATWLNQRRWEDESDAGKTVHQPGADRTAAQYAGYEFDIQYDN